MIYGKVTLKFVKKIEMCRYGLDSSGSEWEPIAGPYKRCSEPSVSITFLGIAWVVEQLLGFSERIQLHQINCITNKLLTR